MIHEKAILTVSQSEDKAKTSTGESRYLPDEPIIKIRGSRSWTLINLREIWLHRELLYFLTWRDLKARYKQTLLGISWIVLQPLLMTLVFTVVLGKLVRVPTGNVPYPLFLYAGLLPWIFFSNAVSSGSYSLVVNAHMITKVFFPRLILPASAVGVRVSDFLVASLIIIVFLIYYGVHPGWMLLILPLLVIELTLLALALSVWLSALNVRYRDIGTALPVVLQLWMFASPIVYPATLVPDRWKWLYDLNPLTGIIEGFRGALLGLPINRGSLITSVITTMVLLVWSIFVFRHMEDDFADVV